MRQDKISMADYERKDLVKNTWRLAALVTGFISCNWIGTFPDIKYASVIKKERAKTKTPDQTMIDKDNDKLKTILVDYRNDPYALFEYASFSK